MFSVCWVLFFFFGEIYRLLFYEDSEGCLKWGIRREFVVFVFCKSSFRRGDNFEFFFFMEFLERFYSRW